MVLGGTGQKKVWVPGGEEKEVGWFFLQTVISGILSKQMDGLFANREGNGGRSLKRSRAGILLTADWQEAFPS